MKTFLNTAPNLIHISERNPDKKKQTNDKIKSPVCLGRLSSNVRILSSLWIILLVFVVTTVLVKVDTSSCRTAFFVSTLASVAVVSGASNLFSGSMFGISGHFPMRITQALISGSTSSQNGSMRCLRMNQSHHFAVGTF